MSHAALVIENDNAPKTYVTRLEIDGVIRDIRTDGPDQFAESGDDWEDLSDEDKERCHSEDNNALLGFRERENVFHWVA